VWVGVVPFLQLEESRVHLADAVACSFTISVGGWLRDKTVATLAKLGVVKGVCVKVDPGEDVVACLARKGALTDGKLGVHVRLHQQQDAAECP
jgi:hypothetical protein